MQITFKNLQMLAIFDAWDYARQTTSDGLAELSGQVIHYGRAVVVSTCRSLPLRLAYTERWMLSESDPEYLHVSDRRLIIPPEVTLKIPAQQAEAKLLRELPEVFTEADYSEILAKMQGLRGCAGNC